MASCVKNIRAKYYQNLRIGFKVTVKDVGNVFRHSVFAPYSSVYGHPKHEIFYNIVCIILLNAMYASTFLRAKAATAFSAF